MALPEIDAKPEEHILAVSKEVSELVRVLSWSDACDAVSVTLGYMFSSIESDEELAHRMSLVANKALAYANRFREAARTLDDGDDGEKKEHQHPPKLRQ